MHKSDTPLVIVFILVSSILTFTVYPYVQKQGEKNRKAIYELTHRNYR